MHRRQKEQQRRERAKDKRERRHQRGQHGHEVGEVERIRGVVKFLSPKGFGFIEADGMADPIFFHVTQIEAGTVLNQGDEVDFAMGLGKNGRPAAVAVRRL